MGSDSDESRSRGGKREKKIKKQKKDKKEKKDKKDKKQKKQKRDKYKRDKSESHDNNQRGNNQRQHTREDRVQSYQKAVEKVYVPRTHIPCRRCQQQTFSLKLKQCTNCGYPKEQRPANFPVMKQVDVLELIRQGKMVHNSFAPVVIQVVVNDRMGRKNRIKCNPDELILDFKRLIAAQIGTRAQKIRLQKASIIFKDHLTLSDYQIKDGMGLQMYYD